MLAGVLDTPLDIQFEFSLLGGPIVPTQEKKKKNLNFFEKSSRLKWVNPRMNPKISCILSHKM